MWLDYLVRVPPQLDRLDVEVCTDAREAMLLRPGRDEAAYRLRHARMLAPTPARRVRPRPNGQLALGPGPGRRCLGYTVSLAEGGAVSALVRHRGAALLANVNAWLYRPEQRSTDLRARLALALPEGVDAALPYPRDASGRYLLDAAAFRFDGFMALGRFARYPVTHALGALEVVALEGAPDSDVLSSWVQHHIDGLAPLGLAPHELPHALFVLAGPADTEPFGSVARGGGGAVLALLPRGAAPRALAEHWLLVHELSHFGLPFVRREDAWLSEGFATYMQVVLPGRAGQRRQRATLHSLYGALERAEAEAEAAGLALATESAALSERGHYQTVYWGGAALCLAIDVALLAKSGGRAGLAEWAAQLRSRDGARELWSAQALLSAIDEAMGDALVAPLVARELARPFPDFRAVFARLGVRPDALDDGADEAALSALRARVLGAP